MMFNKDYCYKVFIDTRGEIDEYTIHSKKPLTSLAVCQENHRELGRSELEVVSTNNDVVLGYCGIGKIHNIIQLSGPHTKPSKSNIIEILIQSETANLPYKSKYQRGIEALLRRVQQSIYNRSRPDPLYAIPNVAFSSR